MGTDWKERGKVTPLRNRARPSLSFQAELYDSKVRASGQILICLLVPWADRHAVAHIADFAGQTLRVGVEPAPEEEG